MEIDNREAVREAVAEGIGIGVIGEHAFTPDPRLATVRIADAGVEIESHVACLKERQQSRLIDSFLKVANGA